MQNNAPRLIPVSAIAISTAMLARFTARHRNIRQRNRVIFSMQKWQSKMLGRYFTRLGLRVLRRPLERTA